MVELGMISQVRLSRDLLRGTIQDGSLKATYEALGLSRKTLYDKLQKHGLKREDFVERGERE